MLTSKLRLHMSKLDFYRLQKYIYCKIATLQHGEPSSKHILYENLGYMHVVLIYELNDVHGISPNGGNAKPLFNTYHIRGLFTTVCLI